jgi:DNA-binding transcriptional ArsR family regulator
MAGRPKIEIVESIEVLKEKLKENKRILEYNKVLTLYILKSEQVKTVREIPKIIGKGETSIHRWLKQYRDGGIENLLRRRQTIGRQKSSQWRL